MERTLSFADDDDGGALLRSPELVLALRTERPGEPAWRLSLGEVDEAHIGRGPKDAFERVSIDGRPVLKLCVADPNMSAQHALLKRDGQSVVVRDLGSKNGTFVNGQAAGADQRACDNDVIEVGGTFFVIKLTVARSPLDAADEIAGAGEAIAQSLCRGLGRDLGRAALALEAGAPILITGPTGSGKEVMARELHRRTRPRGPWIATHCAALAPSLLESELFGHVKGAFSGADRDAEGLFRAADGGTVFLDEIGELNESAQVKLLRVLQERTVTPVGSTRPVAVDFQLLSATHRDVAGMVREGTFREDLYGRIRGSELAVPPLRERRQDIGVLTANFLASRGLLCSRKVARQLFLHDFPRNVRELEMVLRSAVGASTNGRVDNVELHSAEATEEAQGDLKQRLTALLGQHRGNVSQVARELGKARIQIRRWCARFDIDVDDYRR